MHCLRTRLGPLGLTLFACQFLLVDLYVRGIRNLKDWPAWLAAVCSVVVWLLLGTATSTRSKKVLVSTIAATMVVSELVFYRYYHSVLGDDAVACARSMWRDVLPVLVGMLPQLALGILLVGTLEFCLLLRAPRLPTRTWWQLGALAIALVASTVTKAWGAPELRMLWSLRLLFKSKAAMAASHVIVPPLESQRARLPNVLFVLSESVRASDYSLVAAPTPTWRKLVPSRLELPEMRSLSSYTCIAVNALLSGVMPLGTRPEVAGTPLILDYLRALRSGTSRLRTLYWSAQNDSAFERTEPRKLADSVAFVDDVMARPIETIEEVVEIGADQSLATWIARKLPAEPHPLFLLAQLTDTHAPYHVEVEVAPFKPYAHTANWSGLEPLHNAYRNAIAAQDRAVLAIVTAFLQAVGSEPFLIFFTSDHGEAFGEHAAIHHGQNLYEEQIHVPAWVAFGNGAITSEQERWLRVHVHDYLTHLDVVPTILDAYGVLDNLGMLALRKRLLGRSLIRPFAAPSTILPISNCSALFPCPLQSFGLLKDGVTLLAQPWDDNWRCVAPGPESRPLRFESSPCAELKQASKSTYPSLPNGRPNR